jgi:hypothetical protein
LAPPLSPFSAGNGLEKRSAMSAIWAS